MNNLFRYLVVTAALAFMSVPVLAQENGPRSDGPESGMNNWYVGLNGGLPFGVSDFSSFGADKTRTGFMGGVYGGYRFDGSLKNILSLEAFAKWGRFSMSERACCADVHYWLGTDGVRYNVPVLDMDGWDYSDLKSRVFMQQYGMQLNINLLGFFAATRDSRWSAEISPLLAAVGTKADVISKVDGASAIDGASRWHLGVGGNVQAACEVTKNLSVGIYTGMTCLTGRPMDGMPELHNSDYVWESGLRIGFSFGRRNTKSGKKVVAPISMEQPAEPVADPVAEPVSEPVAEPVSEPVVKPVTEPVETPHSVEGSLPRHAELDSASAEDSPLPIIYFEFRTRRISWSELPKVEKIKVWMDANPDKKIEIIGWADYRGDANYNMLLSHDRAKTIKQCLVNLGIASDRITTKGMGVHPDTEDVNAARRVECVIVE